MGVWCGGGRSGGMAGGGPGGGEGAVSDQTPVLAEERICAETDSRCDWRLTFDCFLHKGGANDGRLRYPARGARETNSGGGGVNEIWQESHTIHA